MQRKLHFIKIEAKNIQCDKKFRRKMIGKGVNEIENFKIGRKMF